MKFSLYDSFTHRDGRTVTVSTIVHDPPWSHDILGSDLSYDSETVVWTVPVVSDTETDGRRVAALLKHSLPGRGVGLDSPLWGISWDRADWARVAERHAAILRRARRGRRRVA